MKELLETLAAWRADGVDVGRAVVVRTFGSAPRPEGAVLLLASDGRITGSVSGGCVEGAAAQEIERARSAGRSRVIRYGISDEQAWDVGLACGGTIDVLVEPEVPYPITVAADTGLPEYGVAVVTPLPPDSPPAEFGAHEPGEGAPPVRPIVVHEDRTIAGTLGSAELDAALIDMALDALNRGLSRTVELGGRSLFIEAFPVKPRLVVVGAVEVARSLVRLARELGYATIVIDGRAAFATPERFPPDLVDRLIVGWPDEVADDIGLGPNDAVAVLTHDVKFDEPAIVEALRRGCRYVGAVGSRKTQRERRERLRAAGLTDEELARLRGPIGLDLGGRAPNETALAIMSEVVSTRYRGSGRPMRDLAREREAAADATDPGAAAREPIATA
jgi:xanthine dehydrogenase accessory factor